MKQIIILSKQHALQETKNESYYIYPLKQMGIEVNATTVVADYFGKKQPNTTEMKQYLIDSVLPVVKRTKSSIILVTDGCYARVLLGLKSKVEKVIGYVNDCVLPEFGGIKVIYSPSWQSLYSVPDNQTKIDLSVKTLADWINGTYRAIGSNILNNYEIVVDNPQHTVNVLGELMDEPELTCDIETYDLKHTNARLGTISFGVGLDKTVCISVEHGNDNEQDAIENKRLLKEFFDEYKGKLIFHNATFDIKCLIYYLYMDHILDTDGLVKGLNKLCTDFEDTKLIAYLATNSCTGNNLSLKALAHEYVGNYAIEDINEIELIHFQDLAEYNMIDCLATRYVYDKYYPILEQDDQVKTYQFFKSILVNIIQMELTGMPIDIEQTKVVDAELEKIINDSFDSLVNSQLIQDFISFRKDAIADEMNAKYKQKQVTPAEVKYTFNPNSNKELIYLLHDFLGFPVLGKTPSGQPAVGGEQIKSLLTQANEEETEVLNSILHMLDGIKIRNTFVKKFLEAEEGPDGWHYLFGSFNLGGTKSGRLSSSNPNLQNIPSGSTYGKLIKSCFSGHDGYITLKYDRINFDNVNTHDYAILDAIDKLAVDNIIKVRDKDRFYQLKNQLNDDYSYGFDIHPGWYFFGIDYASLEDRINTLITRDPNKMAVYLKGYDGHSLRAVSYWKDQFPDVDINNVEQVNAITDTAIGRELRQKSKAPTFALTYSGTYLTLMKNCGFNEDEAKRIEANYHELYKVSDAWLQTKLDKASIDGYVTLAFGLRLRTPILAKSVTNCDYMPTLARKEARTAGNALSGQSYCLLNSRAGVEFQQRVLTSKYWKDIKPCAHIHDASYGLVKRDPEVIEWLNKNLVECIEWQNLPELQHDEIKLTGNLGIFYPTWRNEITLPHRATTQQIIDLIK